MLRKLEYIGYESGLTMQPIPYRFYLNLHRNEITLKLK